MRTGEDRIKKLISKSTVVDSAKDIPKHQITEVRSLDEFEAIQGQLYFCEEDQAFYKKGGASWMRYAYNPQQQVVAEPQQPTTLPPFEEEVKQEISDPFGSPFDKVEETQQPEPENDKVFELEKKVFELSATVHSMKEWQDNTIDWAHKMKEWVQKNIENQKAEFEKLKVAQDEGFLTLKDNYELKIEELRKQMEQWIQNLRK